MSFKISDFTGSVPKGRSKQRPVQADPGQSPGAEGRGGRCPQIAPRQAAPTQEPGIPSVRPAVDFRPGSGSHDRPAVSALIGITHAARLTGISKSVLGDWIDQGVVVAPRHEHPSDRRRGLCYTTAELSALTQCLSDHYVIVWHKDHFRKSAVRPDNAFTADLVDRFNMIWASESAGKQENIQGSGDFKAILLDEVEVAVLPDRSQVVRMPPPGEGKPLARSQDIRQWRAVPSRPQGHTRAARRRGKQ